MTWFVVAGGVAGLVALAIDRYLAWRGRGAARSFVRSLEAD